MNYRELDGRSDRLADHLRAYGVGPEVFVGVYLPRSVDLGVAVLAVLKAGGAVVPIESDIPPERLVFLMADSQMGVLVTDSSLCERVPPEAQAKILVLDGKVDPPCAGGCDPGVSPANAAYAIYTSGSTGRPKGVVITHEAFCAYAGAAMDFLGLRPGDRVLHFATFGFDVSLDQLVTPLLAGATVVLRGPDVWSPARLTRAIREYALTAIHLSPLYWQDWVKSLTEERASVDFPSLRLVQVGGDLMPVSALHQWLNLGLGNVRLFNRYGPSETTMFATAYEVAMASSHSYAGGSVPIGRPVGPRVIRVMDGEGNPVPPGEVGEIFIGGPTLARGYLGLPELTAERFLPDPASGRPDQLLYKTGDLGRLLPDGNLEMLGRLDSQVKVRSFRVELGEIESVLQTHDGIDGAVVIARDDGAGDKELVAFLVAQNAPPSATELRTFLQARLPDYMVPSVFLARESFPRTPAGKLDRQALARSAAELAFRAQSVEDPLPVVEDAEIFNPAERARILADWNDTERVYRRDRMVHQLVEEQAERIPEAVAVECDGRKLTYAELNARANVLAHRLRSLGVGPEALVGVCVERSEDMMIAPLAVFKAGGAFVPMMPDLPAGRLSFLLQDTAMSVLVTRTGLIDGLVHPSTTVVLIDGLPASEPCSGPEAWNPKGGATLSNLAYVIYTSGSSGTPKGVMVEQGSLLGHCLGVTDRFPLGTSDRTLHFHSFGFDVSVEEIFAPLISGATIVIGDPRKWDASSFTEKCFECRLTTVDVPPAFWEQWVETLPAAGAPCPLPRLRSVSVGGDVMSVGAARRWQASALRGVALWNCYGPTEATIFATSFRVPERWPSGMGVRRIPIGRPLPNRRAYVLDPGLRPVRPGITGELYLGGEGLARGYLNQPGLTGQRFLPDPFSDRPGARMYKTGDLVAFLPDGNIEFLGRADFQVKLRGFRIEPGEIESALSTHPAVRASVVVLREGGGADRELVAYLLAGDVSPTASELRNFLAAKLPDYMVPSAFIELPVFPLTSNGKVDRKALGEAAGINLADRTDFVAPRTDVERRMVALWERVLDRDRIGINDHFLDLGGHSLKAMRLVSHIEDTFHVELSVRSISDFPTVAGLAVVVERSLVRPVCDERSIPVQPRQASGVSVFPASMVQAQLWFLHRMSPGRALYNLPLAIRLSGPLMPEVLEAALTKLVERHESLRTNFRMGESGLQQVISPPGRLRIPLVDLDSLPAVEREEKAGRMIEAEALKPFDLINGPPLHCTLYRLEPERHLLFLSLHHILSDGWSQSVLLRDLEELYHAGSRGVPPRLPELPIQFADFAVWQRARLTQEVSASILRRWRDQSGGCPPELLLPADFPRPAMSRGAGRQVPVRLEPEVIAAAAALAKQHGCTVFTLLLAGFQALLHRYSGMRTIVVGSPVAGRPRVETEAVVGLFANLTAFVCDFSEDPSLVGLLGPLGRLTWEAQDDQDVAFSEVVKVGHNARDPGRNPLFRAVFALHNTPEFGSAEGDLDWDVDPVLTPTSRFDLELSLGQVGPAMQGALVYDTELFAPATAEALVASYELLMDTWLKVPGTKLSAVPLVPAGACRDVPVDGGGLEAAEWRQTVHRVFESRASKTPDAIAMESEAGRMSYGELNGFANRLAVNLLGGGLQPGERVALFLDPSCELVAGMLAVLKAGGVYMPIDPADPSARLVSILEEARPAAVLTLRKFLPLLETFPAAGVTCLDEDRSSSAPWPDNPGVPVDETAPACVMFTSGSSGRPKGVVVLHRAICRLVIKTDYVALGPEDVVAQASNPAFDAATFEIWGALLNGARLVRIAKETLLSPDRLSSQIRDRKITVMFLTTALFNQIARDAPSSFGGLKNLLFGGEAGDAACVNAVLRHGPPQRLLNMYGPTETTTFATWYEISGLLDEAQSVPIGRPISGVRISLLDGQLRPVPVGFRGEICIGGSGVAAGYLERPEMTAGRFVPDPSLPPGGGRIYRSGDFARYRPDGNIEFLGRADRQLKLRGFRIEPSEIERALATHRDIRDCAVVPTGDGPPFDALTAFFTTEQEADLPADELRRFVSRHLPPYMVPAKFVRVDAMPLTSTGKIDREALRCCKVPELPPEPSKPLLTTPLQTRLGGIWKRLLDVPEIGPDSNFFELGGHSLKALSMVAQINEAFGIDLPLRKLIESPTISGLAVTIASLQRGEQKVNASSAEERGRWNDGRFIVPMGDSVAGLPLFVIPGGLGEESEMLVFASLFAGFRNRYPVYAIQSRAEDESWILPESLQEQAAAVLHEIRPLTGDGPFVILGECIASRLAMEIAGQAERETGAVVSVILLDPPADFSVSTAADATLMAPDRGLAEYYRLLATWKPGQIRADLNLILCSANPGTRFLKDFWSRLTSGEFHVHEVGGDHYSYIREEASETVGIVEAILQGMARENALPARRQRVGAPSGKVFFEGEVSGSDLQRRDDVERLRLSITALGLEPCCLPAGFRAMKAGDALDFLHGQTAGGGFVWCRSDVALIANPFQLDDGWKVHGFRSREVSCQSRRPGVDMFLVPHSVWDSFLVWEIPDLLKGGENDVQWFRSASTLMGRYDQHRGFLTHIDRLRAPHGRGGWLAVIPDAVPALRCAPREAMRFLMRRPLVGKWLFVSAGLLRSRWSGRRFR